MTDKLNGPVDMWRHVAGAPWASVLPSWGGPPCQASTWCRTHQLPGAEKMRRWGESPSSCSCWGSIYTGDRGRCRTGTGSARHSSHKKLFQFQWWFIIWLQEGIYCGLLDTHKHLQSAKEKKVTFLSSHFNSLCEHCVLILCIIFLSFLPYSYSLEAYFCQYIFYANKGL